MDKKSLMVGDWVYNTNNQKNEQVAEIGSGLVMLDYNDLYEYEELEPIPLTPEILEKNGFRIIFEEGLYIDYFQDLGRFHVDVIVDKDGIYQKLSIWDGLGNRIEIVECKYVHQLQHALRLCGIDKQIIL